MVLNLTSRLLERRRRKAAQTRLAENIEFAASLEITPKRVLEEYRRIAFANLTHIVHWDDKGMKFNPDDKLTEEDVAAISEIVESAKEHQPYRVKLYDKRAALDALARYLGMNQLAAVPDEHGPTPEEAENARHRLIDGLDRIAAQAREGSAGERPVR